MNQISKTTTEHATQQQQDTHLPNACGMLYSTDHRPGHETRLSSFKG